MCCPLWRQLLLQHTICMQRISYQTASDNHLCNNRCYLWKKNHQLPVICDMCDIESIVYGSTFQLLSVLLRNTFSGISYSIFSLYLQVQKKKKKSLIPYTLHQLRALCISIDLFTMEFLNNNVSATNKSIYTNCRRQLCRKSFLFRFGCHGVFQD